MRKKFKRYAGAGMAAALFLAAVPMHPVSGADLANSESVVESGTGIKAEDAGGVADYQDESAAFNTTEEDIAENGQAGADSEDVTTAFTDPNFLAEVRKTLNLGENDPVTKEACETLKILEVNNKYIESLAGIEYFTELTYLDCSNNELAFLDVTKCTKLTQLYCGGNELTDLDVSKCTELRELRCGFYNEPNDLTELDLSQCTKLQSLICENNLLTTLDISRCPELETIYLRWNQLTSLDISKCPVLSELRVDDNQLAELDLSQNTDMKYLSCKNNQLKVLDVSKCSALENFYCSDNQISEIDLSQNGNLIYLDCGNNLIKTLDVSVCSKLADLYCNGNKLTALDVGNCPDLVTLNCSDNYIKSEDDVIGRNDKLSYFYFGWQNSGNVDDVDTENITEFFTDSNFQTAVRETLGLESGADITRSVCAEIKELNVSGKNIQDFSGIEYLTGLESLDCSGNPLVRLDVSGRVKLKKLNAASCASLENLSCHNDRLEELNIDGCGKLAVLNCRSNRLKELNIPQNSSLTQLYCSSNRLQELNIPQSAVLRELNCSSNRLTALDVSPYTELTSSLITELI